jgi:hypothetical protein
LGGLALHEDDAAPTSHGRIGAPNGRVNRRLALGRPQWQEQMTLDDPPE